MEGVKKGILLQEFETITDARFSEDVRTDLGLSIQLAAQIADGHAQEMFHAFIVQVPLPDLLAEL